MFADVCPAGPDSSNALSLSETCRSFSANRFMSTWTRFGLCVLDIVSCGAVTQSIGRSDKSISRETYVGFAQLPTSPLVVQLACLLRSSGFFSGYSNDSSSEDIQFSQKIFRWLKSTDSIPPLQPIYVVRSQITRLGYLVESLFFTIQTFLVLLTLN